MKRILIIPTLLLFNFAVSGQDIPNPTAIIETIIRAKQDTAHILYYDSVATSYRVDDIKTNLAKRTIKSLWKDSTANNSITLTKAEQKYIFNQLDSLRNLVWTTNLFTNSTRVSHDSLGTIVFKEIEKANRLGWKAKSGKQIWEFTNPIFLRQNSICLLFTLYICGGLCGRDELCFYENINGNWKKWITVSSGVF